MRNNHKEEIFRFIDAFYSENGYAPSLSEIGREVGISARSAVQKQVRQLESDGRLSGAGGKYIPAARQPGSAGLLMVPVLGTIAAGVPIQAIQELEGYVAYLPRSASADKVLFALRVKGESMIEAGIFDGDIVIVEQTPEAENGQIVAAMVDGEATVKRFYKENGRYRLQPENPSMAPILVDHVDILGRVVSSQRYY